jgi:chorismate dehydratase
MTTAKHRIALVEYLNTRPFTEGLRLAGMDRVHDLLFGPPSACARLFAEGRADISLCPVGALGSVGEYKRWSDYCIGADGPVRTVVLFSRVPLDEIRRVRLDDHSRTSNLLLSILAARHWKTDWTFYTDKGEALPESALMIGDKVFAAESHYPYKYDLAEAWTRLTGLPMVFAVWIARPEVPDDLLAKLNAAFKAGMDWIDTAPDVLTADQLDYFRHSIAYGFGERQQAAMELYLQWAAETPSIPVHTQPILP